MKKILSVFVIFITAFSVSSARDIKGRVTCNGKGVRNVIVTDGTNFTKARANGSYRLSLERESQFVYIVTPAGYIPDFSSGTPEFYQEIRIGKGQYDFELGRITNPRSKDYTLFAISDPQIKTREHLRQFEQGGFRDMVKTGKKYSRKGQLAGLVLGDICWDSMDLTYPLYKDLMSQLEFPVYNLMGNHDHNAKKQGLRSREDYEEWFGPANYAFWIGSDLVICVDNIMYDTGGEYTEGYPEDVLSFVGNLLRFVPKGTHVILAQHSPAHLWWMEEKTDIANAGKMFDLLRGYQVDILSGHSHMQNNEQLGENVMDHNVPSICGAWWQADWCRDGAPAGYAIFTKRKGQLSWFYHSLDKKDDYQVEIIRRGKSLRYPDSIIANVWDYDDSWSVTWYQDGELMGPMERVWDCSPTYVAKMDAWCKRHGNSAYYKPVDSKHYFKADPKPGSKVTVIVRSRFGKEWKYDVQ